MVPRNQRQWVVRFTLLALLTWLGTVSWVTSANAFSGFYSDNCLSCHVSTPTTCAGCHAHGVHSDSDKNDLNVSATPDSSIYNPGAPISVAVDGGYRNGWVRVQMWDQDCSVSGTCAQANAAVSESSWTSGNTAEFPGPVTLTATAPTTPGNYTWYAGWYGNEFDADGAAFGASSGSNLWIPDVNNPGHGNELVAFNFTVAAPDPEICNDNIDNNNDGLIDCQDTVDCAGFVGAETTCGEGACAATGNLTCQNGGQVDTCMPDTPGAEGPFDNATCSDNIDNDCDGLTDASDSDCTAPPEICDNGSDDNGNGLVDCADPQCENFEYGPTTCGVGACEETGMDVCQNGSQVDTCTPGTPGAEGPFGSASCTDGIDNNCDGLTDASDPSCTAPPENCNNNIDDNGDSLIDCEDPQCANVTFGACDTTIPGVCAAGTLTCDGSDIVPVCVQDQPSGNEGPFGDASCIDGVDNDCNGLADANDPDCQRGPEICNNGIDDNGDNLVDCEDPICDGFIGQPGSCNTGLPGVCSTGTTTCSNGAEFCDQEFAAGTEGPSTSPTCSDGQDNDCDGQTDGNDQDCIVPLEVCDNGQDDNSNSLTDCEDPQCEGIDFGACDTGNPGICSAGTLTCDGSQVGTVCSQNQTAQPEGPAGSASCSDGLDNDCDGLTDADDTGCQAPAIEICDNNIDDNGNGLTDCQDPACDQVTFGACDTGNSGACMAGTLTCDGTATDPVCIQNQESGVEGPYTSMTCQDGVDNDCDGMTDAGDADCEVPVCGDGSLPVITEMEYNQGDGKLHIKGRAVSGTTVTVLNADTEEILAEGIKVREGKWEAEIKGVARNLKNVAVMTSDGCSAALKINNLQYREDDERGDKPGRRRGKNKK